MSASDILPELGDLFAKHGPAVYRRAFRLLGNRADAEEATQEVFLRAFRSADSFAGQSQITTWLYRITTNYCLNQIRDHRRRKELLAEHYSTETPISTLSPSDYILLQRLLTQANEEQARVAIYIYLDGMSHDEVAEILGVSRRTVGNLLTRFQKWAEAQLHHQEKLTPSANVEKSPRGRSDP